MSPEDAARKKRLEKADASRKLNARVVRAYLKAHPCEICGETDIEVLDFDHVRGKKHRNVSDMVNKAYSLEAIFAEIAKCRVVCSNDHRRAEAERRRKNKKPREDGSL